MVRNTLDEHRNDLRVSLSKDSQSAGNWSTTLGGGMVSVGVGGPLSGRGANILIIDDPIKNSDEANSITIRDKIDEWWRCFHPDHDILTIDGWKPVASVSVGEMVATLNPVTREMTYAPVVDTSSREYRGDMLSIHQRLGVSFMVTPNHTFFVSGPKDNALRQVKAEDLPSHCRVPQWGRWQGTKPPETITWRSLHHKAPEYEFAMHDWLELVGWFIAEGSVYSPRHQVQIAQNPGSQRNELESLLDRMKINFHRQGDNAISFQHKGIAGYFATMGHAHEKRIPRDLLSFDRASLNALLRGLMLGGGHWESEIAGQYSTTSTGLADDVQELAFKCGYRATISQKINWNRSHTVNGRAVQSKHPLNYVSLRFTENDTHVRPYRANNGDGRESPIERIPYSGPVHCITVEPYHTVLTRHRGRMCWTGNSTAFTRLEPGAGVAIIMTRWSEDDIVGRVLQRSDKWVEINLPALATEDNDPIGRKAGEALWPERYNEEKLEEIAGEVGTYWFSAMYQQRPAPREGGYFQREWFTEVHNIPEPQRLKWVRFWDLAGTDGAQRSDADYTVGALIAHDRNANEFYIADIQRFRKSPGDVEREIVKTANMDGPFVSVWIEQEPGSAGKYTISQFKKLLPHSRVRPFVSTGPKESYADVASARAEQKRIKVFVNQRWNLAFYTELEQYPRGAHDDQVDAMSKGIAALIRRPSWGVVEGAVA